MKERYTVGWDAETETYEVRVVDEAGRSAFVRRFETWRHADDICEMWNRQLKDSGEFLPGEETEPAEE